LERGEQVRNGRLIKMNRPGFRDCSGHWVTGSGAGVV
jgi:hypothetical protein